MATKQIAAGGIRVYSRHSQDCKRDSANVKCDCPKWIQYQLSGKQVRQSAGTRSFTQALLVAEKKAKELSGEVAAASPEKTTIEQVVSRWLAHREQEGTDNRKARLMSAKLVAFCEEHGILFMSAITRAHLNAFKLSLKFRSGNSNSLRVHLSVLGGLFRWAVEEDGCLSANPFPRYKIKFKQQEVVIPTTAEVSRVLAVERTRLFASLMRYSGMAIQDAATLQRSSLVGNLITGNRLKTHKAFRVRIPVWLADELRALPGEEHFFWDKKSLSSSVAEYYRVALNQTFKEAGVDATPHGFRHYFISSTLATGVSVEDVSHMVGSSPNEIRKTYRHWIKEATDRLDDVQQQAWVKQGLDANGNPRKVAIQ